MIALVKKSILLLIVIFILVVATPEFMPVIFKEKSNLDTYLAKGIKILYFNDSVDYSTSSNDTDTRRISTILQEKLDGVPIGVIVHGAYNTDIYDSFVKYAAGNKNKPEVIIIPVNLRSMSPQWDMRFNWQFEKQKAILKYDSFIFRKFTQALFAFSIININTVSERQYLDTPVYYLSQRVGTVRDYVGKSYETFSDEKMKKKIILHYMFRASGF